MPSSEEIVTANSLGRRTVYGGKYLWNRLVSSQHLKSKHVTDDVRGGSTKEDDVRDTETGEPELLRL